MDEQDKSVENEHNSNGRAEITQVGQVMRSLSNATRQLAAAPAPASTRVSNSVQRERLIGLIAALGDTEHPLHQQSAHDLVAIGDAAVPALNEALNPRRPWLMSYRAAEVLGQIGDGRATSALIEALRHPNSNVRWSAIRALAAIGDARAMLDLRRIAREDRARTSWGEPLAGAAQSALDQMRTQNVLLRSAELVKTAIACVFMLVALIIAWSVVTTLRSELQRVGREPIDQAALFAPVEPTADPSAVESEAEPTLEPTPTIAPEPTAAPLPQTTTDITGTVLTAANVRSEPRQADNKVGNVSPGDDILFLATTPDNKWYRVKLGERRKSSSRIDSTDGSGWVIATLLSKPAGEVNVEEIGQSAEPTPAPGT